jgi:surfeit locus 1 family protein
VKAASIVIEPAPRMSLGKRIATGAIVALALALLLSLGTWQVQRLHWKEGLLVQISERRQSEPVPLGGIAEKERTGEDEEYARVVIEGVFDHSRERHFFATHQGRSGFYIYTPMTLSGGKILFVNRGFVPYEMKSVVTRMAGQVEGPVSLTGYFRNRLSAKPSWLVPDNDPAKNIFYWKDLDAMAATAGLDPQKVLPFFVDVDDAVKNPGGFPQGGVTQFELSNNHLQYAVTWYGLALALALVAGVMVFKRKP